MIPDILKLSVLGVIIPEALLIVAISLLIAALAMYRSSKRQKYANNLLALKGLRSQMNPHFVFNSLDQHGD